MRYYIAIFLSLVFHLSASPQDTDISQREKPTTLKVLLHKQISGLHLEVKGRHYIYNPLDGTQVDWGLLSKRFPVKADAHGIHWGEKFPGSYQLRFVPGDSQSAILVNGIQYKGCIELYLTDGKFNVVNEVDIENYLKSTLSSQFSSQLPDEEMNAIAIIARTHAYFIADQNRFSFWHVTANNVGYKGASILAKHYIDKAVNSTYHLVMTYHGKPFAAGWTQNSAGRTADFATIFRKSIATPPGTEVPIAFKDRKKHGWGFTYSKFALAEALELSRVASIDLYVVPDTEKVYAIKVSDGENERSCDFAQLQKIIGKDKLLSNDFQVKEHEDELLFTGFGEGPGIGLCLYSAQALAEKGSKAPQILEAFFPETTLEKVR